MNCPECGMKMREGSVAYAPDGGLHFLPPGETLPLAVTRRSVENRGGVVLDGPRQLGYLTGTGRLSAFLCGNCRKVVIEY